MRKLRILVDMDSILADFLEGLWDSIEAAYGERPKTADVKHFYRMQEALPPKVAEKMADNGQKIEDFFYKPGFFLGLKPIPGAQAAMQKLVDAGHEVVIVTTPSSPTSAQEKLDWMPKHFPMIKAQNICIFGKKYMLKGDVLIDDASHNAKAYIEEWPFAVTLTPAYPYNEENADEIFDGRFEGPVEEAWERIVAAVEDRAGSHNDLFIPERRLRELRQEESAL